MKEILGQLKESIEIGPNTIQFAINGQYYEMDKLRNGKWNLITLFGSELPLNLDELTGLSRLEVEKVLEDKFVDIKIY